MKYVIVKRPWGVFERFTLNEKSTVKILTIKAGEAFSLQYHKKRKEFWRILSGSGTVTLGSKKKKVEEGDELIVPARVKHRVQAQKELKILEISFGTFDERDIVRLEDKYGRV